MSLLSDSRDFLLDYLFPGDAALPSLDTLSRLPAADHISNEDTIALFEYAHRGVKDLVWEVKYRGNRAAAARLGTLLYDALVSECAERNLLETFGQALLLPMPTSDKRRVERGWNQAELLAEGIKACDTAGQFTYRPEILVKSRHTESQTKATGRRERLENLSNSMLVCDRGAVADQLVILVDDVTTTGATFMEGRRALRQAGARKIICMAVAH